MCYHIKQTERDKKKIQQTFHVDLRFDLVPAYYHLNGFDRGTVMIITEDNPHEVELATWSVAPPYCDDLKTYWKQKGGSVLNTRDDSLFSIKAAKWKTEAVLHHKCLVIVSGFYEPHKGANQHIPYLLYRPNYALFGLLGYYTLQAGHKTCSILTTKANEQLALIHNVGKRMPIMVHPQDSSYYFNLGTEAQFKNALSAYDGVDDLLARSVHTDVLNAKKMSNRASILNEVIYTKQERLF
ncbi:SOS response-associated peptidase [Flavobacteriaceae bacterium F08102]|nr:SOS response-associated peptidase [Flavobacteriaceae bacterium F08102]